ncbi:hypothetical protein ACN42_g5531 [Penicillium freii]|uniref:Uncharacterized protein n=1 Tax=Penicillium freii TaxID=48697 RepID=A0A117NP02_PENFR|nr:hypothetical protein ACN42_g5531 [Penicillium freii]
MGFLVEFVFFSTSSAKAYFSTTLVVTLANPFLPGSAYAGSIPLDFMLTIFSISHHYNEQICPSQPPPSWITLYSR